MQLLAAYSILAMEQHAIMNSRGQAQEIQANQRGPKKDSFGARYPSPHPLPPLILRDAQLPTISVITPSYNQGQFIRETIQSVLTQDYPNLEYWVIDGGSTDETLAVLRDFEHDQRFHWLSEADQGQSDAINKGLARCQGELCSWLNSDDILLPGALQTMGAAYKAVDQPLILYGLGRYIDDRGRPLGYCQGQSARMTLEKLLWVGKYALAQPATFVPTSAFRRAAGLDVNRHFALDLDLWLRLGETLPLKFVASDIALYRLHPASKTVSAAARFVSEVNLILEQAVDRGRLLPREAKCRGNLFGLRTYLMPDMLDLGQAQAFLLAALRANPLILPEAMVVLIKAAVRLAGGERAWTLARWAKAKFG